MTDNGESKSIYNHNVLEFVTVGIEFCAFLEQSKRREKDEFVTTMLKLLPLLYVKAQLLPRVESYGTWLPQGKVTEDDYNYIRGIVYDILGEEDQYLDTQYEAGMEDDEPRWKSVSEHLADIYQPVRNFLAIYQDGVEDCMQDALWELTDHFELYWGEALVDALKRIHKVKYCNDRC